MLRIGVLGTGHLGEIHLRCIKDLGDIYDLVGFYDPDSAVQESVSEQYQLKRFETIEDVI